MSLLEHAAVEAAKKFAENEENRTETRGVVKASKVFPVVSVFSVLMGIAMALLKLKQGGVMFYVLAAAFVLLGVFLLIYGHNFKIEYDRTGITVYNFFGKPKQYELQDVQKIELKSDGYTVLTAKGKIRVEKDFFLGSDAFLAYLRDYMKEKKA
ncbi:hypothetical protein [Ruminococcus sp.]|uniref:hypothetical protein n=1 Tax=Ruminococcus sp. TaxID=41978 RepID=UPI00307AA90D